MDAALDTWGSIIPECLPLAAGPTVCLEGMHVTCSRLNRKKTYLYTTDSVTSVSFTLIFFQAFPDSVVQN